MKAGVSDETGTKGIPSRGGKVTCKRLGVVKRHDINVDQNGPIRCFRVAVIH